MKVSDLKNIPQRRARRCSWTPARTAFSSSFQLLSSFAFGVSDFHSSDMLNHS
ncbi:Uncharacterised protein [Klebsiella pneumoniae]|nr:Uncharacterised protein [Klebsiella pneumoniae]